MKTFSGLKIIPVVLALAVIAACTELNTKAGGLLNLDTDLKLAFITEADINPDDKNQPSPLFIRMYELKSTKQF